MISDFTLNDEIRIKNVKRTDDDDELHLIVRTLKRFILTVIIFFVFFCSYILNAQQ